MKKRYYKEISRSTFDFVFQDSPVELVDMMTCYDVESFEYFMVLTVRNVSGRVIASADVRLDLYDGISRIPYQKIEYTYKVGKKRRKKGEDELLFGTRDYIPLPQSYFKSVEITVLGVTYSGGERETLNLSSKKKPKLISAQPDHIVTACEIVDDNESVRDKYPAVIMPEFGKSAWICCCAHKNRIDLDECALCSRRRDDLMALFTVEHLELVADNEAHGTYTMTQRRIKGEFMDKRDPKVIDAQKEEEIAEQIKKVEAREKYKDKMRIQALPRLALYFVLAFLLYFVLCWIFGLVPEL